MASSAGTQFLFSAQGLLDARQQWSVLPNQNHVQMFVLHRPKLQRAWRCEEAFSGHKRTVEFKFTGLLGPGRICTLCSSGDLHETMVLGRVSDSPGPAHARHSFIGLIGYSTFGLLSKRSCCRESRQRRSRRLTRQVVAFGRRAVLADNNRWLLASKGRPLAEDDADGSLMRTVEGLWLTRGLDLTFGYLSRSDRTRIFSALCVAALAHKNQKRKSGEPYLVHPVIVAELLASLKVHADVLIAGLLHDTVEDNPQIGFHHLEAIFGKDVRRIVEGETKASKRTGLMRSEFSWSLFYEDLQSLVFGREPRAAMPRESDAVISKVQEQAVNLRDLFLAMADDYQVIIVKLADRLHNMRTLEFMPARKQKDIAMETMTVFVPLAHRLGVWVFKTELEDLSFKYLHPEAFGSIERFLRARRGRYRPALNSAADALKRALREDDKMKAQSVQVEITSRQKGMYSLWRKLQRNPKYGGNLDNVKDIIAMRVVLDTNRLPHEDDLDLEARRSDLCYHALCLAHTLPGWAQGSKDCLKDYIEHPKPNGYRSLHAILIRQDSPSVTLEVQIRTRQMHAVAECGMAAHWDYKGQQGGEQESPGLRDRRVAWLASLQDKSREHEADPIRFVQEVLREELGTRCYVFLRNGRILNLSRGCTVLDAAFSISSEVGMHMMHPEVNGGKVSPSYQLQNGDRINIITSPEGRPDWEWLDHAFLRSTKNSLLNYFWQQRRDRENRASLRGIAGGAATFATGMAATVSILQGLDVLEDLSLYRLN